MADGIEEFTTRMAGVVHARLRAPKTRKGTRHWADQGKSAPLGISAGPERSSPRAIETKALDPSRVVPDSLPAEIVDTMRPVVFGVARDAAADVADRLSPAVAAGLDDAGGMFAIDNDLLSDLVDEALQGLLGNAQRYAAEVRQTVLDGDRDGRSLDDLMTSVDEALARGGNWLRLSARTAGTALAGKAQLEQARALGVTHAQWVSRRDDRVRPTHVDTDGQVRPIGAPFRVGAVELEYPGDPTGLPETAAEVHGCRCGLIFADADDDIVAALTEIAQQMAAEHDGGADAPGAAAVIAADADDDLGPAGAPEDVVGWRLLDTTLDASPGQRVHLPAGTTFALASPRRLTTATIGVLVPRGTPVEVTDGTMTLVGPVTVEVLAAGEGGMQGRLV